MGRGHIYVCIHLLLEGKKVCLLNTWGGRGFFFLCFCGFKSWRGFGLVNSSSIMFLVHPHTLTALIVLLALMFYAATRSNYENTSDSIKLGVLAAVACFVFIGMLHFPDGPFVRPSKPIWRAVLSLSVLYQLFLVFMLFMVSSRVNMSFV